MRLYGVWEFLSVASLDLADIGWAEGIRGDSESFYNGIEDIKCRGLDGVLLAIANNQERIIIFFSEFISIHVYGMFTLTYTLIAVIFKVRKVNAVVVVLEMQFLLSKSKSNN